MAISVAAPARGPAARAAFSPHTHTAWKRRAAGRPPSNPDSVGARPAARGSRTPPARGRAAAGSWQAARRVADVERRRLGVRSPTTGPFCRRPVTRVTTRHTTLCLGGGGGGKWSLPCSTNPSPPSGACCTHNPLPRPTGRAAPRPPPLFAAAAVRRRRRLHRRHCHRRLPSSVRRLHRWRGAQKLTQKKKRWHTLLPRRPQPRCAPRKRRGPPEAADGRCRRRMRRRRARTARPQRCCRSSATPRRFRRAESAPPRQ